MVSSVACVTHFSTSCLSRGPAHYESTSVREVRVVFGLLKQNELIRCLGLLLVIDVDRLKGTELQLIETNFVS